MTPVIELKGVHAGYGAVPVLRDINLSVKAGEVVALIGSNGAGKSTMLRVIGGELPVQKGEVRWMGERARGPLHARVKRGLGYVMEERTVSMTLTTKANLRLGRGRIEDALALFPALEPLMDRRAGLLSGGEQQMLALARALAAKPAALVIDELSLGLAPVAVQALLPAIREAAARGAAVLLVEQAITVALSVADRGYVLSRGRIMAEGTSEELRNNYDEIEARYLSSAGHSVTKERTVDGVPQ